MKAGNAAGYFIRARAGLIYTVRSDGKAAKTARPARPLLSRRSRTEGRVMYHASPSAVQPRLQAAVTLMGAGCNPMRPEATAALCVERTFEDLVRGRGRGRGSGRGTGRVVA